MITDTLAKISAAAIISFNQMATPLIFQNVLASHEFSLEDRYPVQSVSDIFKDNILLNLAYLRGKEGPLHMDGKVSKKEDINWDEVKKPFTYEFKLEPGQSFAYHDDVLPQYKDSLVKTTQAHFNSQEGFKTDGYLFGDGVCHLASLIYWVAKDASLETLAPTNHDFMEIPEIDKQYGVSIFSNPFAQGSHTQQNLYITNNKNKIITFKFDYNGDKLKVSVVQEN